MVVFDAYVIATVAAVGSADLVTRVRALWRHADSITHATGLLAAAGAIVVLTLTPTGQAVAVPLALVSLVGGLVFMRSRSIGWGDPEPGQERSRAAAPSPL